MRNKYLLFCFFILIPFLSLHGQTDSVTLKKDSSNFIPKDSLLNKNNFTPNKNLDIEIFEEDNSGIKVDGELNEPIWKRCKMYGNFSEVDPGDNTKPSSETEVQMFYDKDNLYVGFTCYDTSMNKLRATMTDRDKNCFAGPVP